MVFPPKGDRLRIATAAQKAAVTFICAPCGCQGRGALLGEALYEGRVPMVTWAVFVLPFRT